MRPHHWSVVVGLSMFLTHAAAQAQVFPPRQPQPAPVPPPVPQVQAPSAAAMPQPPASQPGSLTKSIPLVAILGDPTKSFIQLGNMRSPFDSNLSLGRGLTG